MKKIIFDASRLNLVEEGITIRFFSMEKLVSAYFIFIEFHGYPDVIKMTEKQTEVYREHLEYFAEKMGFRISEQQKGQKLTFRGATVEVKEQE